jgi:hypothetical protein
MERQEWSLGTAVATVKTTGPRTLIVVRGIVTAAAYEALHWRIAAHRRPVTLVLGADVVLVATSRSLAEAAVRGTGARCVGPLNAVFIAVPAWRLPWALQHCALLCSEGLARATVVLEPLVV